MLYVTNMTTFLASFQAHDSNEPIFYDMHDTYIFGSQGLTCMALHGIFRGMNGLACFFCQIFKHMITLLFLAMDHARVT